MIPSPIITAMVTYSNRAGSMETAFITKHIYVLRLQHAKYYVGSSDVPEDRIVSHFTSHGSAWTRKYPPIDLVQITKGNAFDEDKVTKQMMHQHGIDNVRGGSYCQVCLPPEQLSCLTKELRTIDNRCFLCNKTGHFATRCPSKKKKALFCKRCGRSTHREKDCYARIDIDGFYISTSSSEYSE